MLLKRDYYKDIKTCPICKGYGILNPLDPIYEYEHCDGCEGFGVYADEEKGRLVFGLPLFVDYPSRKKLNNIKLYTYIAIAAAIIISLFVIF